MWCPRMGLRALRLPLVRVVRELLDESSHDGKHVQEIQMAEMHRTMVDIVRDDLTTRRCELRCS